MYIHEQKNWPNFIWNNDELFEIITKVSFKQGQLLGKMQSIGFDFRQEALLDNLTEEITKSSEIEGELLNKDEVRSSIVVGDWSSDVCSSDLIILMVWLKL